MPVTDCLADHLQEAVVPRTASPGSMTSWSLAPRLPAPASTSVTTLPADAPSTTTRTKTRTTRNAARQWTRYRKSHSTWPRATTMHLLRPLDCRRPAISTSADRSSRWRATWLTGWRLWSSRTWKSTNTGCLPPSGYSIPWLKSVAIACHDDRCQSVWCRYPCLLSHGPTSDRELGRKLHFDRSTTSRSTIRRAAVTCYQNLWLITCCSTSWRITTTGIVRAVAVISQPAAEVKVTASITVALWWTFPVSRRRSMQWLPRPVCRQAMRKWVTALICLKCTVLFSSFVPMIDRARLNQECSSSAAEHRALKWESPGSNPVCCHFESSLLPFRIQFAAISNPVCCHFESSLLHFESSLPPFRIQFAAISNPVCRRFESSLLPFRSLGIFFMSRL